MTIELAQVDFDDFGDAPAALNCSPAPRHEWEAPGQTVRVGT